MTIAPEPAPFHRRPATPLASERPDGAAYSPAADAPAPVDEDLAPLWPAGDALFTRLQRLRRSRGSQDEINAPRAGAPADPLAPWARAFARGDRAALLRRLSWDGIDPAMAVAALADGRAGTGAPNASQRQLLAAVARAARSAAGPAGSTAAGATRTNSGAAPADSGATSAAGAPRAAAANLGGDEGISSGGPFEELWRPWLAAASARVARHGPPRGWTAGAWADAGSLLLRRLEIASRPTVLELLAAERRRDPGPGAAARLCRRLLASGLADLYREAPVLLRRSAGLALDWAAAAAELAMRLDGDRQALAAAFGGGRELGSLAAVAALGADPHHGGRQVLRLDFTGGLSLAYKPRDVGMESGLEQFLAWMARQGCAVTPRVPRTLARDGYGWQEWVEPEPLRGAAEIRRYFELAGAWLCVAHVLRAQDLHAANVVATRRGPVVVDCEMFLQPDELRLAPGGGAEPAHQSPRTGLEAAAGSCLASGLVTDPLHRSPAWAAAAGGLERPRQAAAPAANVPLGDGVEHGPEDHPGEVAAGFAAAYRFLVARRGDLLAAHGPLAALGGRQVRVLFRTSQHYADVLGLLAAPRYQRSGTAPSLLLESLLGLFAGAAERPAVWPLVAAERAALERLDVPRFTAGAADRVLVTSAGERVEGLCAASGCEAVAARLRALGEADLARQQTLLRRALRRTAAARSGQLGGPAATAAEEALRLGHQLLSEIGEIGEVDADGQVPASLALGDGACGQALFLAALAAVHRQPAFAAAARRALAPVLAWREGQTPPGVGGMTGIGSVLWTLTWCASLLDDPGLLAAALPIAAGLAAAVDASAATPSCDVHDGTAGALLGLLALYDQTRAPAVLELALGCGERLLGVAGRNQVSGEGQARARDRVESNAAGEGSRPTMARGDAGASKAGPGGEWMGDDSKGARPGAESMGAGAEGDWPVAGGFGLAGFAHGAAGIARALAALAAASGEERFRAGAMAALAAERRLFDPARRNWALVWRAPRAAREGRRLWQVAWCHGAPGAGLARAFVRSSDDRGGGRATPPAGWEPRFSAEMEAAAVTAASAPAAPLDHLCCGNLGRASCLAAMGDLAGRSDWRAEAERIAASALAEAARRGAWGLGADGAGAPAGEWSFLRGLAGIGYQLLALSAPGALPCPLALESPGEMRRRSAGAHVSDVSAVAEVSASSKGADFSAGSKGVPVSVGSKGAAVSAGAEGSDGSAGADGSGACADAGKVEGAGR
jgi:lantibiotic modifying enzyme